MHMPKYLWGEAVLTSCYLINRMSSRMLKYDTPLQTLRKKFLRNRLTTNLPLKVFGCTIYVHIPNQLQNKLEPIAKKCVFIGYASNKKGYKCFNPTTRKFHITMDVNFVETIPFFSKTSLQGKRANENQFWHVSKPVPTTFSHDNTPIDGTEFVDKENLGKPSLPMLEVRNSQVEEETFHNNSELRVYSRKKFHQTARENPTILEGQSSTPSNTQSSGISDSIPIVGNDLDIPIALRKGVRTCTRHPIVNFLSYYKLFKKHKAFISKITNQFVPRNVQEAFSHSYWRTTILEEINALKKNETWELVELPKGKKTVGCKWVFTIKCKVDGSIERYEARLVAKGFTQTFGLDYHETFALIAKINSIRVLLSLAVKLNWSLYGHHVPLYLEECHFCFYNLIGWRFVFKPPK